LGIAAVIFPRVFRYARNLLIQASARAHVITARAKGLGPARILFRHVLPCVAGELRALAGVSLSLAFTAAIPVEAICDSPGVGQLAWQAALARDLPLLTNLTLIVTAVTLVGNSLSDWSGGAAAGGSA
jgi:peptide/nickel transport system permease protein